MEIKDIKKLAKKLAKDKVEDFDHFIELTDLICQRAKETNSLWFKLASHDTMKVHIQYWINGYNENPVSFEKVVKGAPEPARKRKEQIKLQKGRTC